MFELKGGIFDVPIALIVLVRPARRAELRTYPEEFADDRVVWLYWLSFDVFLIACKQLLLLS